MSDTMELIDSVNRCQVEGMKRAGQQLDPSAHDSCEIFSHHLKNLEAALRYTHQAVSQVAIKKEHPEEAAALWSKMVSFCDSASRVLCDLKDIYPFCGTPEIFNLALEIRSQSEKRRLQNLEDAECEKTPPPNGLFQEKI